MLFLCGALLLGAMALGACKPKLLGARFRCDPMDPDACPRDWSCQRVGTNEHHFCYPDFQPEFCGNGILETDEECDGAALPVETCRELGYWSGYVYCDERCRLVEDECRTLDRLAAGLNQTCGIDSRDELWCWGRPMGPVDVEWPSVEEPIRQLLPERVHSLAVGVDHACAIDFEQNTWCWGKASFGQLGTGELGWREHPSPAAPGHHFRAVFAGEAMSCGIDNGDEAFCWGLNDMGQLGIGSTASETASPERVDGGHRFLTLSLGFYHGCGVDTDGNAWCWGTGLQGEVADAACVEWAACPSPVPVPGITDLTEVAVGLFFSCALDVSGQAWCWGRNMYGELGDGGTEGSMSPVPVTGGHVFDELVAGPSFVCGVEAGEVWCWGLFEYDQPTARSTPERIDGVNESLQGVTAGLGYFCGVGPSGLPLCRGYNGSGQLGTSGANALPREVTSLPPVSSVSLGAFHSCAVDETGQAWCWGYNNFGQLGHAALEGQVYHQPAPRPVGGNVVFRSVTCANMYTCGIDEFDRVRCWGINDEVDEGQLYGLVPQMLGSSHDLVSVASGRDSSCGLDVDGRAFCWGNNESGQIGDGTYADRHLPTPVAGDHRFGQLSVGLGVACGIDLVGDGWCWGDNSAALFGDGSVVGSATPTPAFSGMRLAEIHVGGIHGCGLDVAGQAWCWGYNLVGGAGSSDAGIVTSPVAVTGNLRFQALAVGALHTCGLDRDGKAYCWGGNQENALGTELPVAQSFAPLAVATSRRFVAIDAGYADTCAVDTAGGLWCWGSDFNGKLGTYVRSVGAVAVPGASVLEVAP